MLGFAFGRMRLMVAFVVRRAEAPDTASVAALNPSYMRVPEVEGQRSMGQGGEHRGGTSAKP